MVISVFGMRECVWLFFSLSRYNAYENGCGGGGEGGGVVAHVSIPSVVIMRWVEYVLHCEISECRPHAYIIPRPPANPTPVPAINHPLRDAEACGRRTFCHFWRELVKNDKLICVANGAELMANLAGVFFGD